MGRAKIYNTKQEKMRAKRVNIGIRRYKVSLGSTVSTRASFH